MVSRKVQDNDEENDILDAYCFKDHTVYSLNATGALLRDTIRLAKI